MMEGPCEMVRVARAGRDHLNKWHFIIGGSMAIKRRRFMATLGALGVGAVMPGTAGLQSSEPARLSYDEVRSKLANTKLFFVPYAHNNFGWLTSNLWDRKRTPLVHKEALEIMRREKDFKWFFDTKFEAFDWF